MTATLVSILQKTDVATSIPDYLKSTEPSAMGGGLGSNARDRIGLKGNRFRMIRAGLEVDHKDENFLDVTVVTANPHVSRIYYAGDFDPDVKTAPDCFSADGITPFSGVINKQSNKCNGCPQNVKGSSITGEGKKTRACSFSKRLVVVLDGDTDNTLYQLDLKAMSIFGDGKPDKGMYTLSGYNKLLQTRNVRVEGVITRMSFDTDSSVPKLYFTPQGFLSEDRVKTVLKLAESKAAKDIATIDVTTVEPDNADAPEPVAAQPLAFTESTHPVGATVPAKKTSKKAEKKTEEPLILDISDDDQLKASLANLIKS